MPRIKPKREHYIPAGAVKVAHRHSSAVAWLYDRAGKPCVVAFHGRQQKPALFLRYNSAAARERNLVAFFAKVQEREAAIAAHQAKPRGLEVGDILRASWGYDQTNIDWYEVTALVGAQMVELRELDQERAETGSLVGHCVPLVGCYKGEAIRKIARDGAVKLTSYATAFKADAIAAIGGRKVYAGARYSEYG